jgi:hypothetical protein
MLPGLPTEIEMLDAKVAAAPESEPLCHELLMAYCGHPELHGDPRRIGHILGYIERFPGDRGCRTPVVGVDPDISPGGFRAVEQVWVRLLADHPGDPDIACNAAVFFALADEQRAIGLLRRLVEGDPGCALAWFEMGRISSDARERFEAFKTARALGYEQPNLLAWVANAAAQAGHFSAAEAHAGELLALVAEARATHGDRLDWTERGRDLWARACAATPDTRAASTLVRAIGEHAHHKHWGHSVMGLVALDAGDVPGAAEHLRRSADVVGDPRLRSYGPSLLLADALCVRGMWSDVAAFLEACGRFWQDERLAEWKAQVARGERPAFLD